VPIAVPGARHRARADLPLSRGASFARAGFHPRGPRALHLPFIGAIGARGDVGGGPANARGGRGEPGRHVPPAIVSWVPNVRPGILAGAMMVLKL